MTNNHFRSWRRAIGLSQAAAADALGLTPSIIEMYEGGSGPDEGGAEIPKAVALACSALYRRLEPWAG